ncbi:DUF185 domain-containing protein [Histoplasma ohiense]|nr:DUF185 domain-containing protein [Histoplasma ohiense (nom. inval.)]
MNRTKPLSFSPTNSLMHCPYMHSNLSKHPPHPKPLFIRPLVPPPSINHPFPPPIPLNGENSSSPLTLKPQK